MKTQLELLIEDVKKFYTPITLLDNRKKEDVHIPEIKLSEKLNDDKNIHTYEMSVSFKGQEVMYDWAVSDKPIDKEVLHRRFYNYFLMKLLTNTFK